MLVYQRVVCLLHVFPVENETPRFHRGRVIATRGGIVLNPPSRAHEREAH